MTGPDRIWEIVERYLADVREGRNVDPEAIATAHADLGPSLRTALASARTINALSLARAAAHPSPAIASTLSPRYERVVFINQGGMGVVLRAHDASLGRDVAVKTLPEAARVTRAPSDDRQRLAEARFRREARLTAALEHPGVPPVYEVGASSDGTPYYAMRLVARDRRTLATEILALRGRRFDERIPLLEVFLRVCDTVAYAHAKGIVHRDLKPENVVIGDYGVVFVVDWGLATWKLHPDSDATSSSVAPVATDVRLTQGGNVLGTAGYLSPEAATGRMADVDESSEVFSLGVMLFEILTGDLPHAFSSRSEYLTKVVSTAPRQATGLDPTIPRSLSDLCDHALSLDRSRRPASVDAMAAGIRNWRARADGDREALRLLSEARAALSRAATIPPEDARRAVARARALVESIPSPVADHPEIAGVRDDCDRASAALDAAERRQWLERDATRRRRQWAWAGAAVVMLAAFAAYRVWVSREQGQADARREAVRQKRASIEATIGQLSGVGLGGFANDLDYLMRLVRDADRETVDSIVRTIDAVSDEFAAARDRALREPNPLGLDDHARIRAAQARAVGGGRQRLGRLLCEALGHIRIVDGATPALARHLEVQYDTEGMVPAGRALARLSSSPNGGERALAALKAVVDARRLDADPVFRSLVLSYLPVALRSKGGSSSVADAPPPPPRRPHGVLADGATGTDWIVPAYVESWIGLGIPRDGQREVRDDLRSLSVRLERTPFEASDWVSRSAARRNLGDLVGAEADLTRAIELDPMAAAPYVNRADARRMQGNHFGAIHDCDAAISRTDAPAEALLGRTITWVDLGDAGRAIEDADAVVKLGVNVGAAYSYRAMARLGALDFAGAERDGRLGVEAAPTSAENWNVLAVAQLLQGRAADALVTATTAATLGDAYALAWNTLGVARCVGGDFVGGRAALQRAIELDAGLPFAWQNLGVCDLRAHRPASAAENFNWAIERSRARLPAPWLGLAVASRAANDSEGERIARDVYRELAPTDPRGAAPRDTAPIRGGR